MPHNLILVYILPAQKYYMAIQLSSLKKGCTHQVHHQDYVIMNNGKTPSFINVSR